MVDFGRISATMEAQTQKRNRTRARACANPRLITSLTLFTRSTDLLSAGVDRFPTVSIMLDSRSARIVAVLIAFSSVAPFSSTCVVHDRRSFHFTRFHGKLKHCLIVQRDEETERYIGRLTHYWMKGGLAFVGRSVLSEE